MAINLKVSAIGVVITFVAVLLETIFIPLISDNLTGMTIATGCINETTPDACSFGDKINSTNNTANQLIFLIPLFTVIGGVVASITAGMLSAK